MRARTADVDGYVESNGVKIHHEVHGRGEPTILLLPSWTVVHKRFWKAQVPYLARHHRVVTYDGPGNGLSDRPLDPEAYDHDRQVRYAVDVLDATGTDRAVVVGLSKGGCRALQLAAEHGDRVLGTVAIGASVPVTDGHAARSTSGDPGDLPPARTPLLGRDPLEHWAKYDPTYWLRDYEDFLWFFFGMCFPEPRSSKAIEDCVGWGLETTPEVLVA
jgi:pimeloyl-ACP methyl ester carboxylesterase